MAEKQEIEQQLTAKEHSLEVNISQVQCSVLPPAQENPALLLLASLCRLAAVSLARTPAEPSQPPQSACVQKLDLCNQAAPSCHGRLLRRPLDATLPFPMSEIAQRITLMQHHS